MQAARPNPDKLLTAIDRDEATPGGQLKLFFGYAAGVGKTYAMLQAAHEASRRGTDVVVGYVEPHLRPKTTALLSGLEVLPSRITEDGGVTVREFDLNAALERNPQLILVDELAHTNAPGSRHTKRYRDVRELLQAGIDVYATLNVQHLESLHDIIFSITGVSVQERIPDSVFFEAAQIELVDLEPQELLQRLRAGEIYAPERVTTATGHFFTEKNLLSLRELALRLCADRIDRITEDACTKNNRIHYAKEHILVCLSSSPSNAKIIRTAARMATAFHADFTALYVRTAEPEQLAPEDADRLRRHIRLAEQLGARIETVYGDDVPYQISEFARLSHISKIVLGRSANLARGPWRKPPLTDRLIAAAPHLDIYIIPDQSLPSASPYRQTSRQPSFSWRDLAQTVGFLTLATLIGYLFSALGFTDANIITVYVLAVLFIAVRTEHSLYSLTAAAASVLLFNFLFTEPKFSLQAYAKGYPVTFLIMFIAAMLTSLLSARLRRSAKQAAQTAYRTKVLLDADHLLQAGSNSDEILATTADLIRQLLGCDTIIYPAENGRLGNARVFAATDRADSAAYTAPKERAVAEWVYQNRRKAGKTTATLTGAAAMYFAIRHNTNVYGVIGIVLRDHTPDAFENGIVLSILGAAALVLENQKNAREKEAAAIRANTEQLRADLLRSISHDLRTPLTSIVGHADQLLANGNALTEATRSQLYRTIHDDSLWLTELVENLLAATRLENDASPLHFTVELVDDVVREAVRHVRPHQQAIEICHEDDLVLARMDVQLIMQVLINLVNNALAHSAPDMQIRILTRRSGNEVVISVADTGPGVKPEDKPHIFEMFYSGGAGADSRRSSGLGLYLCRRIVQAHGSRLTLTDNHPHGSIFSFTLPPEEVRS